MNPRLVIDNFNKAFCPNEAIDKSSVKALLKKLELKSNISYLTPHESTFSALARDTIYKFSEIDLQHGECEEILNNLVGLVEKKSLGKLVSNIDESDLDEIAGVGISDMLDILSISKGAYKRLKDGGDTQAIKNASIIQRLLSRAGASEKMIEYSSSCKVKWDIWFRDKRHTMLEFDLNFLQEKIAEIASSWTSGHKSMDDLQEGIEHLFSLITEKGIVGTLNKDLLLGAIFSAVVRSEA